MDTEEGMKTKLEHLDDFLDKVSEDCEFISNKAQFVRHEVNKLEIDESVKNIIMDSLDDVDIKARILEDSVTTG